MTDDQVQLVDVLVTAAHRLGGWQQATCETREDGTVTVTFKPSEPRQLRLLPD